MELGCFIPLQRGRVTNGEDERGVRGLGGKKKREGGEEKEEGKGLHAWRRRTRDVDCCVDHKTRSLTHSLTLHEMQRVALAKTQTEEVSIWSLIRKTLRDPNLLGCCNGMFFGGLFNIKIR